MAKEPGGPAGVLRAPRVLLAILTAAAFANSLPNGFVWLDHWQVERGGLIVQSWPELWAALRQPLGSMPGWEDAAPYARPSVLLLLSAVHWLVDAQPLAYHSVAALIHLANVLLLYGLLRQLAVGPRSSFVASALFAVHPLQTAAVSWISGIADPLFTLFVLSAFRCQLAASARLRSGLSFRLGAALSFLLALGAKETAMVFPFLLGAMYLLGASPAAQPTGRRARPITGAVALFFVLLVGDVLYRSFVLHAAAFGGVFGAIPLSVRLRTAPRLIMSYFTLPLRFGSLTVCDDYALSVGWDAWTAAALVALAALLVSLLRWWRRCPHTALGLTWMLLGLVPVLNIVPILHYRADRFFYSPMIGWSLACVTLLERALAGVQLRRAAKLAISAIVVSLVILTIRRNALFTDDVTLFESTLRVSPLCREARTALGDAYLRAGRAAEALEQYQRAVATQPDRASYVVFPKVLINLGMAQLARNNYVAAEDAFSQAHRLQPGLLHPLFGLGVANLGLGRVSAAAGWLEQAYALDPGDPDVVFNLALSYDRLGRAADARRFYQRYLDLAPRGRARPLAEQRVRALTAPSP